MTRLPSTINPFNIPTDVESYPLLYRSLIRILRIEDEQNGNLFLKRFLTRPQEQYISNLKTIAALWDCHNVVTCPDDLLIYLKDIVGFDEKLDHITDRLSSEDLRRLIAIAIPLWKARFSETGLIDAIRFFTGRTVLYVTWFDWRAILGEVFLDEEQAGFDFWVIGGIVTYFDEYYSQIRAMDDGTLDRLFLLDVVQLERPLSERIEVAIVDFQDYFDANRDLWNNRTGTVASITTDETFLIPSGTLEEAIIPAYGTVLTTYKSYVSVAKFNLSVGATLLSYFYYDYSSDTYYYVEVYKNYVELWSVISGTPTSLAIATLTFPIYEDAWYKLRIAITEDTTKKYIKVYIDGNKVIDISDSTSEPDEGIVAYGATGSSVQLDNVEIYRVPLRYAEITSSGVTTSNNFYDQ